MDAPLSDFLKEQNNVGSEVFFSGLCTLKRLYGYLSGQDIKKIKIEVALRQWGRMQAPYDAYYGQLLVQDVAAWAPHGKLLFAKNLRYFRGDTPINENIEKTLVETPENFWYFNNGITMLCNSVAKTLLGGSSTDLGIFNCEGASVVNGAQTVGVIWELAKKDPIKLQAITAPVQLRIISLEKCPEGFGTEVTRAANTQNPIRARDYAALDPEQQRLATEMQLDKRRYAYKSGDLDPKGEEGCNIEEATVALACASSDVAMAVSAKREVGQLWQAIQKPPYTILFNSKLTAQHLWRAVLVLRAVEEQLKTIDTSTEPRGELVAIHGNRFILHRVFTKDRIRSQYGNSHIPENDLISSAKEITGEVFVEVARMVQQHHSAAYLANVFKNAQKNKDLEGFLESPPDASEEPNMRLDFGG